jgi:hypothetical protein
MNKRFNIQVALAFMVLGASMTSASAQSQRSIDVRYAWSSEDEELYGTNVVASRSLDDFAPTLTEALAVLSQDVLINRPQAVHAR